MAKTKRNQDLVDRLRLGGLRKRSAELIAEGTDGRRKPAKQVRRVLDDLTKARHEAEDRITGGPAKRKAAAKKGALTSKRNAAKRSTAAKKGARTRAKSAR